VVDQKFVYDTDHLGRVVHAEGHLDLWLPEPDRVRNDVQQQAAGVPDRLSTDHGGHFFGAQFGGPAEGINMSAMDGPGLNKGAYRRLENLWSREIKAGHTVDVRVDPVFVGDSRRAARFAVTYRIDGGGWTKPKFLPNP